MIWKILAVIIAGFLAYGLLDTLFTRRKMDCTIVFDKFDLQTGEKDELPVLFVVMPSRLSRKQSVLDRLVPLLQRSLGDFSGAAKVLIVDIEGGRFDHGHVARRTAFYLDGESASYSKLIFVGQSMGGKLSALVIHYLKHFYRSKFPDERMKVMAIDSPFSGRDLAMGGGVVAWILRWLPVSNWVNFFPGRLLMKMFVNLPKGKNISDMADYATLSGDESVVGWKASQGWVKARAKAQLSGHQLSVWRDMMVAMSTIKVMPGDLSGIQVIYLACTDEDEGDLQLKFGAGLRVFTEPVTLAAPKPHNDTVKQPQAALAWYLHGDAHVWVVRSTHCGFEERPNAWEHALKAALKELI